MKLFWRHTRLMLSAAVALGALGGLTVAAAPAYAAGPHISVLGGPGEIMVQGGGFTPGATVRLEALTPDLSKTLDTVPCYRRCRRQHQRMAGQRIRVPAEPGRVYKGCWGGGRRCAGTDCLGKNPSSIPSPRSMSTTPHLYCNGLVSVFWYDFEPWDTVRLELLSADLRTVMDTQYTTVNVYGGVPYLQYTTAQLHLTPGYHGPVVVFADEYWPGGQTTGAELSEAC